MNEVIKHAGRAMYLILVALLCAVLGPIAYTFDLVWVSPAVLSTWLEHEQVMIAYQMLWQSVHQSINWVGEYGLVLRGYEDWIHTGIPASFVLLCLAMLASFLAVVMMLVIVIKLRSLDSAGLHNGGGAESSARRSSTKGLPTYRPVTRAIIDAIESNLQAFEEGMEESQTRLAQARQTVLNLSLDSGGPRSEQDLALLREQLDQVRASLERQRGPQHAMMANLSKF